MVVLSNSVPITFSDTTQPMEEDFNMLKENESSNHWEKESCKETDCEGINIEMEYE